ncbi:hypothetical protein H0E87_028008 [Populus deltoides]|uniref:Uncharacterized protein n=1 Tax=Populus deltoides TaxID=3696 RepID=A0A8T2WQ63_POPDE|nr:hypothetical protein H0E87_028008 [Populus deltoides]
MLRFNLEMASKETGRTVLKCSPKFRYQDRNSPIPYLFSSIGLMFGLVAVALMILACSYRKSSPNSATDPEVQEKSANQVEMKAEMEPKIVVIMAGDDSPTYLANPVSCNCQSDEQV